MVVPVISSTEVVRVLGVIREKYLDHFRRAARAERAKGPLAVGLSVVIGDGSNPHGSRFNLPIHIDLVAGSAENPRIMKVELDTYVSFDPVEVQLPGGVAIRVGPFQWDWCPVAAKGDADDWSRVLAWFEKWFDRAERGAEDADGLCPVIHEMTEPEIDGDEVSFSVDFGSAPTEAFLDLMSALHERGMKDVRAGRTE